MARKQRQLKSDLKLMVGSTDTTTEARHPNPELGKAQLDPKAGPIPPEIARMERRVSTQQEVINTFKQTVTYFPKHPYTRRNKGMTAEITSFRRTRELVIKVQWKHFPNTSICFTTHHGSKKEGWTT